MDSGYLGVDAITAPAVETGIDRRVVIWFDGQSAFARICGTVLQALHATVTRLPSVHYSGTLESGHPVDKRRIFLSLHGTRDASRLGSAWELGQQ